MTREGRAQSLPAMVDAINEAAFYGRAVAQREARRLAAGIAERQGGPRAYGGSFALDASEEAAGVKVFTGERMTSASARHIIGEESCRALLVLGHATKRSREALRRATEALGQGVLEEASRRGGGVFCCGKCSVALWRHLAAGGFDASEARLDHGMSYLAQHRDGDGGWRRFPFFYTLLALTEIDLPSARREIEYVSAVCEKKLARKPGAGVVAPRRHDVMRRALARI